MVCKGRAGFRHFTTHYIGIVALRMSNGHTVGKYCLILNISNLMRRHNWKKAAVIFKDVRDILNSSRKPRIQAIHYVGERQEGMALG